MGGQQDAESRASLLRLLLSSGYGTISACMMLLNLVTVMLQYGGEALGRSRPPDDPDYLLPTNMALYLNLELNTFIYSLSGVFATLPFVLSPASRAVLSNWLAGRSKHPERPSEGTSQNPLASASLTFSNSISR